MAESPGTSVVISAQDKTAAAFKAVEGKLTSLSAKTAENANKLAGVAAFMGQSAGSLQGIGKAAELAQVGIVSLTGAMSVLGGPAGIILGVVGGIAAWALTAGDAEAKTYGFSKRVAELKDNMLEVKRIGLQEEFDKTKREIAEIQEKWRTGPPLFGNRDEYYADQQAIRDGNRVLNELRHQIDATQKQIQAGFTGSKAEADEARAREQLAKEQERARAKERLEMERAEQQRQRELEQSEERFRTLQTTLLGEEQAIADSYYKRLAIIEESEANKNITDAERMEARFLAEQQYEEQITALHAQEAQKRAAIEQKWSQQIMSMKFAVAQQAAGLLRAVAGNSREAAIAVIAVEKGLAIAQTVMNTEVAAMRAFADLGPIAGAPVAAKIKMLGATSVGLIAATGLVEAANVPAGGASLGTPGNPVHTTAGAATIQPPPSVAETGGGITQIQVIARDNDVVTGAQMDQIFEQLEEAMERGDRVIFSRNSRQAQELMA